MKVVITIEDEVAAKGDYDHVGIEYDFDPPMEDDTPMTAAGFLAAECMATIQKHMGDEVDEDGVTATSH